jgi:pyrimidine-nucleoside phosphorylase
MRATDIIARKRDGKEHTEEEIKSLIGGYLDGSAADYQVAAWLMAVYLKGMSAAETGFLTRAMIASGKVMDMRRIDKPLVDKHSSGGVGDKISLPLAPLAAAMGLAVPMMSGRALGITGGTLDKLESIDGYHVRLTEEEFISGIAADGYAMTGQTADVAPADRLLYALRDVTATVESVSLITASILSKKFAEGAHSLVLDVKCGKGAFMKNLDEAELLASSIISTAAALGRRVFAFITNMNEPLGFMTGNFLEVEESIRVLEGGGPADITELTLKQAGAMALAGGLVSSLEEGVVLARKKLAGGEALELFYRNVERQGGSAARLKSQLGVRRGKYSTVVKASATGFLNAIDAGIIGRSGIVLGVGRNKTEDSVDSNAGFIFHRKSGAAVQEGEVLAEIFADSKERLESAAVLAGEAFVVGKMAAAAEPLIYKEILAL